MIMIVVIAIWLQSASILSKAFTGLLLKTYFNVKSVPIVNSLQEVLDNHDMRITIRNFSYNNMVKVITNDTRWKIDRKLNMGNLNINIYNKTIFQEVIMGKSVLLQNSLERKLYLNNYKMWQDKLAVAEEVWNTTFTGFRIPKSSPIKTNLTFL